MATKKKSRSSSQRKTQAASKASRQLHSVIWFAVAVFLMFVVFIKGEYIWTVLHEFMFRLFGVTAYFYPFLLGTVAIIFATDKLSENIPTDDTTVKISALKGEGIDRLLEVIAKTLPETAKRMKLLLPYDKAGLCSAIRENGKVFSEEYTESGVLVDALVDKMNIKQLSPYEIK